MQLCLAVDIADSSKLGVCRCCTPFFLIPSSDIIWNKMRRGNRLKPLKPDVSEALEDLYNTFLSRVTRNEEFPKRVTLPDSIRPTTTVDLNQMVMLEPENCTLQRTFEPGMQLQYRGSANQIQIHVKIFRVQVDSQRLDAAFPVVFAPFPQPASVVVDSGTYLQLCLLEPNSSHGLGSSYLIARFIGTCAMLHD